MNRKEHLLQIAQEECIETAHRLSKALRFGLTEVQEGQPFTNAERVVEEFNDLVGVMDMLYFEGHIPCPINFTMITKKKGRVDKWLEHSRLNGTLTEQ